MGSGESLNPPGNMPCPYHAALIKTFSAHKCLLEDVRPPLAEGHFIMTEPPLPSLR